MALSFDFIQRRTGVVPLGVGMTEASWRVAAAPFACGLLERAGGNQPRPQWDALPKSDPRWAM
ncbi:hypothetical protein GEMMAAP_06210 [Gemmatimonas phototrophica]|uniref:Uncharacterized protein n=1 Tax=Gemmatimonas phototrophica TaxID=1379270 RepID=A0A143BHP2_9BACT|nr:hypothetical protein GEMMAAP_06210 [Gemmatimonas phototrophica]